ncbi:DUF2004 domain-containing protein [Pseudobacter ginsenosidimutans]|uniref:Uncharacterized protein DUF2004 n=1 Tax=Pseudobacter ginsenosidimutans TaxID=661488 RepID=A0A4Q7N437_9BACT|nr:DUF2004 domain-containing protein [Pseudobacter ginsenosidimutans]QEC44287.1 DUF2004 domain-containing protein [Pseudobacter ginsenosidimutans]RZS75748.1 uncharacterized protein DUF2004 [Pseudobacter ginsenosidimutans]
MPIVELPFFGPINTASVEEYYESDFQHNSRTVSVDLNFENNTIDEERLLTVKKFLRNIPDWLSRNNRYILDSLDDDDDDTVREYAEYLKEVLEADVLARLIQIDADPEDQIAQIAEKLHLVRIGLYPDGGGQFAVFDYTIGQDIVDYLVVINTDEYGVLEYMTMES